MRLCHTLALMGAMLLAAITPPSLAHAEPSLRVCTAGAKGNYYAFGQELSKLLGTTVPVTVVETDGSWDNLGRLKAGSCDAAVVQSDADIVYRSTNGGSGLPLQRLGVVVPETINLVCSTALKIDDLDDLVASKARLAVGPKGSGSWVTWQGLVTADRTEGGDEYSVVPTTPDAGTLAITKVVDGSDVGCMLFTMSANSDFGAQVQRASGGGDVLHWTSVKDKDFDDTLDARGKSIYRPVSMRNPNAGLLFGRTIDTLSVDAVFFVTDAWAAANPAAFSDVVEVFLPAVTNLKAARGLN